ncbi:uncharacterized protein AMSG_02693 [Thecamonas trahens ATCC 50062]|uniref:Protein HGH1 homolog n=1 Tax=Thecamonas trahens ATCC 50062 TaxID=461836 RepID=A0A0L0D211_THETB|nr:hypothetical protein AMSG_02693 [Thecamonas trahens ATCC 50062]KNC46241.1 hypothetical protein AMSG_02693 [Thecamonas trahens ATCC 50062]|eukprot:XP_013760537.1 hypothetical protein AMSG_02693 [Thecamonas trahens ATCC 50062]
MSLRAFQSTWFDATWKTIFGEYHVVDVLCALLAGSEADASLVLESLATVTDQAEVAVAVAAAELPAPRAGEKLLDVVMKAASCVDEDEEDEAAAATLILSHLALVNELANELVDRGAVARFCALASVAPSAGGAAMATRKPLMLLMGNLARSEEQCVALMKAGFCEAAVFNLRLVADDDDELPLQHAILGSLRNLAIARPVRAVLRTSGVLDELLPILASPHQPMQFNAAAIARHLVKRPAAAELETPEGAEDASGAAEAALYLATVPGFVARLAELAAVEAVNVKMESARALAALAATPESSMATGAALPSLAPFTVLLESEHAVLHTEAVAALGSLAAVSPPPEAFSSSDARDGCVAALDALGESALDAVAVAASIRGTA